MLPEEVGFLRYLRAAKVSTRAVHSALTVSSSCVLVLPCKTCLPVPDGIFVAFFVPDKQALNEHQMLIVWTFCLPLVYSLDDEFMKPCDVHLQAKLNEYEFPVKKVANVQSQLSRLIEKNYYLNKSAREVRRVHLSPLARRPVCRKG